MIDPPVIANFEYRIPDPAKNPNMVEFTNTSTGPWDVCIWDFGDGNSHVSYKGDDPVVFKYYLAPGTYEVRLIAEYTGFSQEPGGRDERVKLVSTTGELPVYRPKKEEKENKLVKFLPLAFLAGAIAYMGKETT